MAVISMCGQEFLAVFVSASWHCFPLFWLISRPPALRHREFWHGMSALSVLTQYPVMCLQHLHAFMATAKLHLRCNGNQICPSKLIYWLRNSENVFSGSARINNGCEAVACYRKTHSVRISSGIRNVFRNVPRTSGGVCHVFISREAAFFTLILDVLGCVKDGLAPRAVPGFHDDWSHYDNRIATIAAKKTSALTSLRKLEQEMALQGPRSTWPWTGPSEGGSAGRDPVIW